MNTFETTIKGQKVEVVKYYRTKTQYEYYLSIFMGKSKVDSILAYDSLHLTKKSALNEAFRAITSAKQPKIVRVI